MRTLDSLAFVIGELLGIEYCSLSWRIDELKVFDSIKLTPEQIDH